MDFGARERVSESLKIGHPEQAELAWALLEDL